MLKASILSLATIVSAVLAGSVKITSPKPGNVWEIGKEVDIYWNKTASGSEPVSILLASGPAQALNIDLIVANKIPVTEGHYKWTVPSNVKPGKKYVVEVGPTLKDLSFAGYITIEEAKNSTSTAHKHASASHKPSHHASSKTASPTEHHSLAPPHPSGAADVAKAAKHHSQHAHKKHGKKSKFHHKSSGHKTVSKATTHKEKHATPTHLPSAI
ncbi:hypothetical protein K450DRAFT_223961 [Umbelopsis ramanniana AG]|uniref:Yeast cell wall synthesis Kre9/Knh1-like N-terminal domain-containing protein n=1 Tax=Umbelopsis ramanniana AG TaxID=1314678 RepID=A0AAD5EFR2_UMBRA|nr:uncharacterized protein K450DRAFT_223961 [Umbelopsis ramanniana AG]KAI8583048.1 hypothetical protein K450DRAFT_223961 [Umbelopsis ramanniana AG]